MKNNIFKNILAIAAVISLASGCKGFLDETDQTKFIASTADHFSSVLLGEFNYVYAPFNYISMMTDEMRDGVTVRVGGAGRENVRPMFCWQRDIEKNMTDFNRIDRSTYWAYCYKIITLCNNIFENLDATTESVPGEKDYVRAEADFVSALLYFNLVNLYAEPYRAATAATTMGIPLREGTGIETAYDRAMLDEVYQYILDKLNESLELVTRSGLKYKTYSKISEEAIRILLSRVYLFMGEWDNVISTLDPIMKNARVQKFPMNTVPVNSAGSENNKTWTPGNSEIVYTYGLGTYNSLSQTFLTAYFNVGDKLFNLYDETDLRRNLWFNYTVDKEKGETTVNFYKASSNYTTVGQIVMRYAEAYLNLAEAYARTKNINKAVSTLNSFLPSRHETGATIEVPNTQKELISFIMDERMREFCFEEHFRWFDLRRMEENERPEITHEWKVMQSTVYVRTETYHLLKNDPNYTLALPYLEKDNNPMILDYDRFDKVPF